MCVLCAQSFLTLCDCQALLSMKFSRKEDWSGLPFPNPGDRPDPGIEPLSLVSSALAGRVSTTAIPGLPNTLNIWWSLLSSTNARDIRDVGLIPGLGRSLGGGHSNPLQLGFSCLRICMNRGAWQVTAHSITKSWTRLKQLSTHACYHHMLFQQQMLGE